MTEKSESPEGNRQFLKKYVRRGASDDNDQFFLLLMSSFDSPYTLIRHGSYIESYSPNNNRLALKYEPTDRDHALG